MSDIVHILFSQYENYSNFDIALEAFATIFGLLSVWFAIKENILVFPTGIINTSIYVYILFFAGLFGDMSINAYYFYMSFYGWYKWTRKTDDSHFIPIRYSTSKEKLYSVILLVVSYVLLFYILKNFTSSSVPKIDALTTSMFFVGMWLMAKKIIDNWIYWIIADLITIPLYIYKGLTITAFQYLVFTILAVMGYIAWKKQIEQQKETLLE
ncbi:MAG: nicotinamide mononucleotide transporter [Flavobacteriales bacterium]|nr:nicotinamide mononucleotide transporter [Flavobacteriales bacterium]